MSMNVLDIRQKLDTAMSLMKNFHKTFTNELHNKTTRVVTIIGKEKNYRFQKLKLSMTPS